MKDLVFNFDNKSPIYLQIIEQIELYIVSGKIPPGERIPSVRDLATIARVNPNTMQRALIELEQLKLITTERTNGKFVTTNEKYLSKFREKFALIKTRKFLTEMSELGFDHKSTIKYLKAEGAK